MAKRPKPLPASPAIVDATGKVVGDWAEWVDILGDDELPTDARRPPRRSTVDEKPSSA